MERLSSTTLLPEAFQGTRDDITQQMGIVWEHIKSPVVVPLLRLAVLICLAMSLMLFVEKVYMAVVIVLVRLFRRRPETNYKWEPMGEDPEAGNAAYPMVLVQIPMYNEKEVYQLSIAAACGLSWPSDRIIIQVLDDSTDPAIKELVVKECHRRASKGVNIKYEIRENRNGYKAGALKEGMKHSYVKQCDYVAIFDADFQPEPDFLMRSVPFLLHNHNIALVQARWKFVNSDECLMTRMQEMSLDYHFTVEQEVGSSTCAFFGFNGTAGVWRISALNEAGGWKDRTTVEDMDLAVRASLRGWKFIFLGDLEAKSELPSTLKAYRYQQHRWSCGPANLFRKMAVEIAMNKKVNLWTKIHVIYSFFFVRKIVAHIVTFIFYCVVIPATVLVPQVQVPKWGLVYVPSIITMLNAVGTPRSLHLLVFWILFENVMSLHRTKATFIGLLEVGRVNEWVVTEKLGDIMKTKNGGKAARRFRLRIGEKLHLLELFTGAYLYFCGCYDLAFGSNHYYLYLFAQGTAFFIVGLGYVGTFVPRS
ncbi:glucomannan 4-beta-mannosyltransferase 9-like isoform X2 [Zingiber officinale]|uniref:glucomannan 4-beta-mannosyltransferase 9-like n=1 Tax=Zingiber officinale TaxID=94328 RepID=UPI001C4C4F6F|nr:glucomannan 4-beta-mannosyltransferase 9-like [Zingiber officinale]XP_042470347.1 glucomannan 4-beta-mannosyltransferase 9-like isoform X2 [Zingiber officinale]